MPAFPASVWSNPSNLAAPAQDPGFNLKGRYWGRMLRPQKYAKTCAGRSNPIAIEFRWFWDLGFAGGSLVATFIQGMTGRCAGMSSHEGRPLARSAGSVRSQRCALAVQQINDPQHVVESGMARGAAITVGILVVTIVNDLLAAPDHHPQFRPQQCKFARNTDPLRGDIASNSDPP